MIMRRPAATAWSICPIPRVSTRPHGSKTRISCKCGYSAATRPRLFHMPEMIREISTSVSAGMARPRLSRARFEMPSLGPIARPNAPPIADAQSRGNQPNIANASLALHASRRCANLKRARADGAAFTHPARGTGSVSAASRSIVIGGSRAHDRNDQLTERRWISPRDLDFEDLDVVAACRRNANDVLRCGDEARMHPLSVPPQLLDFPGAVWVMVRKRTRACELCANHP